MARVLFGPSDRHLGFLAIFQIGEISFSVCCWRSWLSMTTLVARTRWFFWSEDVVPEVVDLPFSSDFINGRRQRPWSKTARGRPPIDVPQRHVPAASMFIDTQNFVGDGAFLDPSMVDLRRLFRRSSRRRWRVAVARYCGCRKP